MGKQSIQNIIALSQLVREEISHADENKIATNSELAELMGCSSGSVIKYLMQGGLSEEEIDKRRHVIFSQTASRTISNGRGIAKQTTEERRAIGDNNYRNGKGIARLTTEERRAIGDNNYRNGKGIASLTEEQRREIGD